MRPFVLASSTALALTLAAPSWALTPDALWDQWSGWLEQQEHVDVPEATTEADGTVLVSGLTSTHTDAQGRTTTATVPELRLSPDNDTVVVQFPKPITITHPTHGESTVDLRELTTTISDAQQPGLLGALALEATGSIRTKGTLSAPPMPPHFDDPLYDGIDSEGFASDGLASEGMSLEGLASEGLASEGLASTQADTTTADTTITFSADFGGVDLSIPGADDAKQAGVALALNSATIKAEGADPYGEPLFLVSENGAITMDLILDGFTSAALEDPVAAISQGMNITLTSTQDAGTYAVKTPYDDSWNRWDKADMTVVLNRDGVHYNTTASGMEMGGTLPEDMGTFGMTADDAAFDLSFPLFAQDAIQSATLALQASGMRVSTTSDALPAGMAPLLEKPMEVDIQAEADVRLGEDIWPTSMDAPSRTEAPDMHIPEIRLTHATIAGLGASIAADGVLSLVGERIDQSTPGAAQANITLTGVVKLLEELRGIDVITAEQQSQATMSLQGLAKPGETDPLTYTIIQGEDGALSVNGNPM